MHGEATLTSPEINIDKFMDEMGPLSPEGKALVYGVQKHQEMSREINSKSFFLLHHSEQSDGYQLKITNQPTVQMIEVILNQLYQKKPIRLSYKSAVLPADIPEISLRVPYPVAKGTRILHGIETSLGPFEISTFSPRSLNIFIMQHDTGHEHIKPIELCPVLATQFSSDSAQQTLHDQKSHLSDFVYKFCKSILNIFSDKIFTFINKHDRQRAKLLTTTPKTPYELSHKKSSKFISANLGLSFIMKIALAVEQQQQSKGILYFIRNSNSPNVLSNAEHLTLYMAYAFCAQKFDQITGQIHTFLESSDESNLASLNFEQLKSETELYTEHNFASFNCIDGLSFTNTPEPGVILPWEPGTNSMCTLQSISFDDDDASTNTSFWNGL